MFKLFDNVARSVFMKDPMEKKSRPGPHTKQIVITRCNQCGGSCRSGDGRLSTVSPIQSLARCAGTKFQASDQNRRPINVKRAYRGRQAVFRQLCINTSSYSPPSPVRYANYLKMDVPSKRFTIRYSQKGKCNRTKDSVYHSLR